jgi:hypothetical protein
VKILKILLSIVVHVVVFDVIGVVVSFVVDVLPLAFVSRALFYAIWLMDGFYCGLFSFDNSAALVSGDSKTGWGWAYHGTGVRTARLVAGVTLVFLTAMIVANFKFPLGGGGSVFVPDDDGLTLTYWIGMVIGTVLLLCVMPMPEAAARATAPKAPSIRE